MTEVISRFGLSFRRVCRLTGWNRSSLQYQPQGRDDTALRGRLRHWAALKPRWGAPILHDVLKAEGLVIDHKRTELGPVVAAQLLGHTITGNGAYQCCTMRRSPRNTLHIGPVVEHLRAERHTIDDTTLSLTTPLRRKHVSRSAARQVSLRSGAHRQTADPPPGETASSP